MKFIDRIRNLNPSLRNDRKSMVISVFGLVSFLCVVLIQRVIRPQHIQLSGIEMFLQGTLPNFFAATGICSISFLYMAIVFNEGKSNNSYKKRLAIAVFFTFLGLTLWEIIQKFMDCPIDYGDIIMTAAGCLLAALFIWMVHKFW